MYDQTKQSVPHHLHSLKSLITMLGGCTLVCSISGSVSNDMWYHAQR